MGYNEKLDDIDERIKHDYERLVAERYLPVFSEVVRDNAQKLLVRDVSKIKLGYPIARLDFFSDGRFFIGDEQIYPDVNNSSQRGLLRIAEVYQNTDYKFPLQTALRMCLIDINTKVANVIKRKSEGLLEKLEFI